MEPVAYPDPKWETPLGLTMDGEKNEKEKRTDWALPSRMSDLLRRDV